MDTADFLALDLLPHLPLPRGARRSGLKVMMVWGGIFPSSTHMGIDSIEAGEAAASSLHML